MPKDKRRYRRKYNPKDIALPAGYKIEVFAKDLTTPINLMFTENGDMLVAEAGVVNGNGRVLRMTSRGSRVIAEGFNAPLTGINTYNDSIYVSHRGYVTAVRPNGTREDILAGLPSYGDHTNNRVVFDETGRMFFGQGTATNSGVVGTDNLWVKEYPFFHDYPGQDIQLVGQDFRTANILTADPDDRALTGAYSPFNVQSRRGEIVKGTARATGSVLSADADGSDLKLVAWGLRNPFRMKFDKEGRLFTTNHGPDVRGSRPIANAPDEFHLVCPNTWYGWPDFVGGLPVTLPKFAPDAGNAPRFLLAHHPMDPPKPHAIFEPHSAIMGFDFNYSPEFIEHWGDVYIAEFGSGVPEAVASKAQLKVGHRVSRIDMDNGNVVPFALNKSGFAASHTNGGGFERPIDVTFGPDGNMYILDFGVSVEGENGIEYLPNTGAIWVVSKR